MLAPTQSATHPGVDFCKIVTWVSLLLAGTLYMVDPLELFSSPVVPICFVADQPDPPALAAIEISDDRLIITAEQGSQTEREPRVARTR
jgi:hypothetical protein